MSTTGPHGALIDGRTGTGTGTGGRTAAPADGRTAPRSGTRIDGLTAPRQRASDETASAPLPHPEESTRAYVYGIGRDDGRLASLVGAGGGVDGHGVRLVPGGGLVALVSAVPAAAFDEEPLRRRLEHLPGLEELARAHHAVVDAAFARSPVLPLRLATVYTDAERVSGMLLAHRDAFIEMLTWLDGHVELGVKVFVDPAAASSAAHPSPAPEPEPASPGRAYLQRRRRQRRGTEDLYRAAEAVTGQVTRAGRETARAVLAHRTQQGELSAGSGVNVANHAYLVPAHAEARFRADVEAAGSGVAGVRVEITGPWAPYSFASPVTEAGEESEGGAPPR
ncbi:GvpL/GvpF family gas vesicle protein [Streptomyces roseolus]|uniref:GvpL/GvpF family gas vesicle protein n=1 Tax=Streptomyces roseolus TaxID=67358 RepID=UPI0036F13CD8